MNLALELDKSVFKTGNLCCTVECVDKGGFVVQNTEVVSNGSWWCSITVRTGAGCGEGMVAEGPREADRGR
jgi:hypothetical protein